MAGVRQLVRDLATPRYAALTVLMIVVAAICCVCGTWQIARYEGKHVANGDLRTNAHDTTEPVAQVLPVRGEGRSPGQDTVEYRRVSATGTYDVAHQVLVRRQQVDSTNGYLVLTPLQTTGPVLFVVRGFVADNTSTLRPDGVPAPPEGPVSVTGRVQVSQGSDDKFAALGNGQVDTVNVGQEAQRLGASAYDGYIELEGGQPGTAGLTAIPAPDLSNPAGGAFELQHLAYIVQWYLFAALALAAPVVMVRTDRKRAREDAADAAAGTGPPADRTPPAAAPAPEQTVPEQTVQQRLAERYGR